jgi:hypothetical protein
VPPWNHGRLCGFYADAWIRGSAELSRDYGGSTSKRYVRRALYPVQFSTKTASQQAIYSSSPLTKRLRNHREDNLTQPEAHGSYVMGLTRVLPYRQQQWDGDRTTSVTNNPVAGTTPLATTILHRASHLPPSHHHPHTHPASQPIRAGSDPTR